MPLTVNGGNGLPKQMDEDSEFDDIELDVIALTAFTGGQATASGNSCQLDAHDKPWGRCHGIGPMRMWYMGRQPVAQTEILD